jgi:hypothetical protein
VPRNDERASDDERLFANVLDCFVPRNDERASDDERLFADVLDCFVPRNDERASDDKRLFNYQLIQSYSSSNPDSDKRNQQN